MTAATAAFAGPTRRLASLFGLPRRIEVPCVVRVSHRFESLGAHVELGGGVEPGPGDQVKVHGPPIHVAFGEVVTENRTATVVRATWIERLYVRWTGDLHAHELIDVSFTERRTP